jgi:acetyl-CoA carboxylase carboxyl transferase subunit beta
MGWFSKSRKRAPASEKKEELWTVCPRCAAHIFKQEWRTNLQVCPQCNYHGRLNSRERLALIADEGKFEELNANITTADPLKFMDAKGRYAERAEEAKIQTGLKEAILTGRCRIHGTKVVVGIMDFRFMGGSLASGTGEKILLASEYALKHTLPYIIFSSSGGARMQEGILSLMQMAKTCAGIARLQRAGIPYISVLTDPTTGGVSASYAMIGDINVAEPGALIGFAGRRVIEQTIKQKLPDDFQTAEYMLAHGFIDRIVPRLEMKRFLHRYLEYSQL